MFTTMSSDGKPERVEVLTGVQRRRRCGARQGSCPMSHAAIAVLC